MTGDEMQRYLTRVWGQNIDDTQRLLILDQARVHTMERTRNELTSVDTDVVFIPAGCTSLLQPADVSWNHPFKNALREEWKVWRRLGLRTPAGNLKMASRYS